MSLKILVLIIHGKYIRIESGQSSEIWEWWEWGTETKSRNGEKIADVLRVSRMSTTDPDTMSCLGTMYALFEIEKIFGMQIEEKIKEYH